MLSFKEDLTRATGLFLTSMVFTGTSLILMVAHPLLKERVSVLSNFYITTSPSLLGEGAGGRGLISISKKCFIQDTTFRC